MASPDVADYVGLELLDLDAQQLIEQALADAALKFPDWTPREGNTEVVLLELIAAMVEEDVYALNRIPDGVAEALLRLFNLTRDLGAAPSATVEFTATDNAGYTIPAGSVVRAATGTADPFDLATDVDLIIAPGATTGTVAATGTTIGAAGNGLPIGTALEVLDALSGIESAELATATAGGRAPEDGPAFLTRATPVLTTLTTTLVRPQDVEAYVASAYPAVVRVKTLDRYDPTGGGDPGDNPGFVTVAVTGADGAALSAPTKATIETDLVARMHAGLVVDVIDADVTTVAITVTVLKLPGQLDATVEANVIAVLEDYLDPDTWDWSRVVRRNEIIARADTAAGVDTVLSVAVPAVDLTLTGPAPLAKAGTITVTVQTP
jgi:hypothetical protein